MAGPTVQMAFLGPRGTYGEQAARAFATRYDCSIDLLPCPTISDIYKHDAPLLVLPLQNTLQGGVLETLDCLLSVLSSSQLPARLVHMDLLLPIRHCLVALKGTKMEEIAVVRSHEQALGQSASFLAEKLPGVRMEKWSSTAGAAVSLLQRHSGEKGKGKGKEAALCSKAVVGLYPDELEVLYEGTQYGNDNYTRFLLLTSPTAPLPSPIPCPTSTFGHEPVFHAVPSRSLVDFLSTQRQTIKSIHARPAAEGTTYPNEKFPNWYLVESAGTTEAGPPDMEKGWVGLGKAAWTIEGEYINR